MRIPLRYNIRNIARRKMRSALTSLGVALVVVVGVAMFAFSRGMLQMQRNSGSPDNIMITSRKSANCIFSSISGDEYNLLRGMPGIKKGRNGQLLIAPEVVQQMNVTAGERKDRPGTARGVMPDMLEVYDNLRITRGAPPSTGYNIAVGELVPATLGVPKSYCEVGKTIEFQGRQWNIVGQFSTGGTAIDSDIMVEISDLMGAMNRQTYSTIMMKVSDQSQLIPAVASLNARNDIQLKAVAETEYYRDMTEGFARVIFLAIAMSVIAGVGGLVGGMNTMYASVLGRVREIGTLRTLGFSRLDVIVSFVIESLIIAIPGGIVGCAAGSLVNGLQTRLMMGAFAMKVDAFVIAGGMLIAVAIGVIGAIPPALRATRLKITDSLRYS
jgi:putative ABC transport system permease protein